MREALVERTLAGSEWRTEGVEAGPGCAQSGARKRATALQPTQAVYETLGEPLAGEHQQAYHPVRRGASVNYAVTKNRDIAFCTIYSVKERSVSAS